MELAAIERILADDPTDREAWAVYADALATTRAGEIRARAIVEALQGGGPPTDPELLGPARDPEQVLVGWRCGFWSAAWVRSKRTELPLAGRGRALEVLQHPSARLLSHLVVSVEELIPETLEAIPASLRRLDLSTLILGAQIGLEPLAPILRRLETLCVHAGVRELASLDAPRLSRLILSGAHPGLEAAELPALEVLELHQADMEGLARLHPRAVPRLHTLRLGSRAHPSAAISGLLSSPLGQQLRHLEVTGASALVELLAEPRRWAHLEEVVVDLDAVPRERPAVGRLRLRRWSYGRDRYLRLAPGGLWLELARALDQAARDLGVRPPGLLLADWISVPSELALGLAQRTAVLADRRTWLLQVELSELEEQGRVTEIHLDRSLLQIHPDGRIEGIEDEITREEISCYASHSEEDLGHMDRGWLEEELWSGLEVAQDAMSVPVGWRPDPSLLAPRCEHRPRRFEGAGSSLELEPSLGAYLVWRLRESGVLEPSDAPELGRWTRRLLRRHDLEVEPGPEHLAYWEDWAALTEGERARRAAQPGRVPSFKLAAPGRWILAEGEGALLAEALRQPILYHVIPDGLSEPLARSSAYLDERGRIEVLVTS
ncbi:MAG TPA: hypothetical protein ENK18_25735 [Deltaproteobacteria bacterium]|nr:hypothetical protein [Deltaproteobacteria bacterium]